MCRNLLAAKLTWQVQLTGACKRIEADQELQLQTHGCKCQMLPRAPSIQRIHNKVHLPVRLCTCGKNTSTSISGTTSSPTPKQNMLGRTLWLPAATVCCSKSCSSKCYRKKNQAKKHLGILYPTDIHYIAMRFSNGICKRHLVKW